MKKWECKVSYWLIILRALVECRPSFMSLSHWGLLFSGSQPITAQSSSMVFLIALLEDSFAGIGAIQFGIEALV
jgi:hypothetical protein